MGDFAEVVESQVFGREWHWQGVVVVVLPLGDVRLAIVGVDVQPGGLAVELRGDEVPCADGLAVAVLVDDLNLDGIDRVILGESTGPCLVQNPLILNLLLEQPGKPELSVVGEVVVVLPDSVLGVPDQLQCT